ncbi:MAG: hypothetical protein RBU37_11535 [Myxococcota bacterium]|nr:hypothetical protein [Myxococcota bacterium]
MSGSAWPSPSSAQDESRWRAQYLQAQQCYAELDLRCVVTTLDGPLLVQADAVSWLSEEELVDAYELLGLSYWALGLEEEGSKAFERLMSLRPDYVLRRPEASPEQLQMVLALRARTTLAERAVHIAGHVLTRSRALGVLSFVRLQSAQVAARLEGAQLAGWIRSQVEERSPSIASPPWGPLTGPTLLVFGLFRFMFLDDARVWGLGTGLGGELALDYRPWRWALTLSWTTHPCELEHTVLQPPPSLEVWALGARMGYRQPFWVLVGEASLWLGLQYLQSQRIRILNPAVGGLLELSAPLGMGFALQAGLELDAVFGLVDDGRSSMSLSLSPRMGLSWSF